MPHFQIKTPSEQLAEFFREQISAGRYRRLMPGMAGYEKGSFRNSLNKLMVGTFPFRGMNG